MSDTVTDATPLNILEEKQRFLQDTTYNPQFKYNREFTPSELVKWGVPEERLYQHALKMLHDFPQQVEKLEENIITQAEIETAITEFNERYSLEKPLTTAFSHSYVPRCRVSHTTIFFQLPIMYTRSQFLGLYRHELETHILRKLNNSQQPWTGTYTEDSNFRRTEEGLANLHTFLLRANKVVRKTYLSYIATYLAQRESFSEVYSALVALGTHPDTSLNIACRVKRGITDTSQPGGITKDICYFEGTLKVWDWLINKKNDVHDLYLGRISIEQLAALKPQATLSKLRYPQFLDDMNVYIEKITEIGTVNQFEKLLG